MVLSTAAPLPAAELADRPSASATAMLATVASIRLDMLAAKLTSPAAVRTAPFDSAKTPSCAVLPMVFLASEAPIEVAAPTTPPPSETAAEITVERIVALLSAVKSISAAA